MSDLSKNMTIRLTPEQYKAIQIISEKAGISKGSYIRNSLVFNPEDIVLPEHVEKKIEKQQLDERESWKLGRLKVADRIDERYKELMNNTRSAPRPPWVYEDVYCYFKELITRVYPEREAELMNRLKERHKDYAVWYDSNIPESKKTMKVEK